MEGKCDVEHVLLSVGFYIECTQFYHWQYKINSTIELLYEFISIQTVKKINKKIMNSIFSLSRVSDLQWRKMDENLECFIFFFKTC